MGIFEVPKKKVFSQQHTKEMRKNFCLSISVQKIFVFLVGYVFKLPFTLFLLFFWGFCHTDEFIFRNFSFCWGMMVGNWHILYIFVFWRNVCFCSYLMFKWKMIVDCLVCWPLFSFFFLQEFLRFNLVKAILNGIFGIVSWPFQVWAFKIVEGMDKNLWNRVSMEIFFLFKVKISLSRCADSSFMQFFPLEIIFAFTWANNLQNCLIIDERFSFQSRNIAFNDQILCSFSRWLIQNRKILTRSDFYAFLSFDDVSTFWTKDLKKTNCHKFWKSFQCGP